MKVGVLKEIQSSSEALWPCGLIRHALDREVVGSNLAVSRSKEILLQKNDLFDIILVISDHSVMGIPMGCRAIVTDSNKGHLKPPTFKKKTIAVINKNIHVTLKY